LPYPNLLTATIDHQFQPIDDDLPSILNTLRQAVMRHGIDVIWMSTFHGGPEHHICEAMRDLRRRPITVGLQHGMVHDWPLFERWTDKFDFFGTFGPHFYSKCSDRFRLRMVTCGLPKLDEVPRPQRSGTIQRILFAAQGQPSSETLRPFLHELRRVTKAEIVIRPHPELHDAYADLFEDFVLDVPGRPILDALRDVGAVITTGSTAALESLASGLPTVVLPFSGGEAFEPAGNVVTRLEPSQVVSVFRRFDNPDFNAHINRFLDSVAGPGGMRTTFCVRQVERLVATAKRDQLLAC